MCPSPKRRSSVGHAARCGRRGGAWRRRARAAARPGAAARRDQRLDAARTACCALDAVDHDAAPAPRQVLGQQQELGVAVADVEREIDEVGRPAGGDEVAARRRSARCRRRWPALLDASPRRRAPDTRRSSRPTAPRSSAVLAASRAGAVRSSTGALSHAAGSPPAGVARSARREHVADRHRARAQRLAPAPVVDAAGHDRLAPLAQQALAAPRRARPRACSHPRRRTPAARAHRRAATGSRQAPRCPRAARRRRCRSPQSDRPSARARSARGRAVEAGGRHITAGDRLAVRNDFMIRLA